MDIFVCFSHWKPFLFSFRFVSPVFRYTLHVIIAAVLHFKCSNEINHWKGRMREKYAFLDVSRFSFGLLLFSSLAFRFCFVFLEDEQVLYTPVYYKSTYNWSNDIYVHMPSLSLSHYLLTDSIDLSIYCDIVFVVTNKPATHFPHRAHANLQLELHALISLCHTYGIGNYD